MNRTQKLYKCNFCDNDVTYHNKFFGNGNCWYCANQLHSFNIKGKFIGKLNNGYKNGNYSNKNCIDCGIKISRGYKAKRCHSCAMKYRYLLDPKSHPWYGKSNISFRYISYKNKRFHSSWEANFAKWCDLSSIEWQYEPKAFPLKINGKETTYTPDFYLPEFNCWIEIKGYWYDDAKIKFAKFLKKYSVDIKLFDRDKLNMLGIIK